MSTRVRSTADKEAAWRVVLQLAMEHLPAGSSSNELAERITDGGYSKLWTRERLYEEVVRETAPLFLVLAAARRVVDAEDALRRESRPSQLPSERMSLRATRDHAIDVLRELVKP